MNRRNFLRSMAAGAIATRFKTSLAEAEANSAAVPSYLAGHGDEYAQDPHRAALAWFQNAKFGMFMHYGLYSQLEHGEWVMLREKVPLTQYEKLRQSFRPDRFDANAIVATAMAAGAKYVTLTSKHHEGFCLFRTRHTDYNSFDAPCHRDLVGELAEACRRKGIGLFLYYSMAADWHHPYFCDPSAGWRFFRPDYPEKPAQYLWKSDADTARYIEYTHGQLRELLTQYGPIAGIWFDPLMGYYARPDLFPMTETYALIRGLQPQCLVSFKQGATGSEDFAAPERMVTKVRATYTSIAPARRQMAGWVASRAWDINRVKKLEICNTLQPSSWGYDARDNGKHRGIPQVVSMLRSAWRENANLLLNTGPLPNGAIPPEDEKTFRGIRAALSKG